MWEVLKSALPGDVQPRLHVAQLGGADREVLGLFGRLVVELLSAAVQRQAGLVLLRRVQ